MMMDMDVGGGAALSDFDEDSEPAPKKTTARSKKAPAPAKKAPAKKAPAKRGKKAAVSVTHFHNVDDLLMYGIPFVVIRRRGRRRR